MSGEDHTLPVELEKLEIVSGKTNVSATSGDENPFQRRSAGFRTGIALWGGRCTCSLTKKSSKSKGVYKRNSGKLLKDPVLKYVNTCCPNGVSRSEELANSLSSVSLSQVPKPSIKIEDNTADSVQFGEASPVQNDFRSLISSCSQLRISNSSGNFMSESFQNPQSRDIERGCGFLASGGASESRGGFVACSQQALNPPCDVTIDELASYFETLVHIPKKMSTMAEMMYI